MPNGYSGIHSDKVLLLNQLLEDNDIMLVISSAWRYLCLSNAMTVKGFEKMLMTHGVNCLDKVHGITAADEVFWPENPTWDDWEDLTVRVRQIQQYLYEHNPKSFVVIDDLALPIVNLVRIDGKVGLQEHHIAAARLLLNQV